MEIKDIKFKAKSLDNNGGWIIGDLVHSTSYVGISYPSSAFPDVPVVHRVDPSTVCQFTGLKDCDGASIYEHDLLRSEKTDSTFEVVWNQGNSSFSLINTEVPVLYPTNTMGRMLHNRRLKVVGNKFDKISSL